MDWLINSHDKVQFDRDIVFNFRQEAEKILKTEEADPLRAACAMKILKKGISVSQISPQLFSDFSDKEYVASVVKLIQENSYRMQKKLSESEISEINKVSESAIKLPDYAYYVKNHKYFEKYISAKQDYDKFGFLSTNTGRASLGCGTFVIGTALMGFILMISSNEYILLIGMGLVIALIFIGLFFYALPYTKKGERGKKEAEKYSRKLNIDLLLRLENDYSGDEEIAKRLYFEAKDIILSFFGNSSLLPIKRSTPKYLNITKKTEEQKEKQLVTQNDDGFFLPKQEQNQVSKKSTVSSPTEVKKGKNQIIIGVSSLIVAVIIWSTYSAFGISYFWALVWVILVGLLLYVTIFVLK